MIPDRDLRIDFLRGVALLIVAVDHIEGWSGNYALSTWTLVSLGFSDAAEVFVFLSGYVFALAYSPVLEQQGLWACVRKAINRSLQIYVAYILAAWTIIAIGYFALHDHSPSGHGFRIGERVGESVTAALSLSFQPYGFPMLCFYILVLPPMALMLHLRRQMTWLAWAFSAGAYIVAQMNPDLTLHRFADGHRWPFNPLAWQFLFFVGLYLAGIADRPSVLSRATLLAAAFATIAFGLFMAKLAPTLLYFFPSSRDIVASLNALCLSCKDKSTLQPLRLLHFLALAFVAASFLPRERSYWTCSCTRPILVCGQHSLELYACGLVLAFLSALFLLPHREYTLTTAMIDVNACVILGGLAWWLDRSHWRPPNIMLANGHGGPPSHTT
jgi:hypothetical protein